MRNIIQTQYFITDTTFGNYTLFVTNIFQSMYCCSIKRKGLSGSGNFKKLFRQGVMGFQTKSKVCNAFKIYNE